jgi:hypothetical protein
VYKVLVGKPEGKRPLGRQRRRWKMGSEWIVGRLAWGVWIGFDWLRTGTGGGLFCVCGDEPSSSCATELVSYLIRIINYWAIHHVFARIWLEGEADIPRNSLFRLLCPPSAREELSRLRHLLGAVFVQAITI